MTLRITYDVDNLQNKFNIDLYISNKNIQKNILETILLNKTVETSDVKYKINIDGIIVYTFSPYIISTILNKLIH
jgi:hypothetical protein